MLTALVLIGSVAATPDLAACNPDNAIDVLSAPATFQSPVTCLLHGQALVAGTALGRDLGMDERIKVVCVQRRRLKAALGPAIESASR